LSGEQRCHHAPVIAPTVRRIGLVSITGNGFNAAES